MPDTKPHDYEHKQGNQNREYTPAQKAAVDRVRRCKHTAYYEILDIKVEATDNEVKKAYRKLALLMHPDKNGAPGADEAFKLVSRAFQVLSDEQKRAHFDRTGGDPDSRFGAGDGAGPSSPFSNGFASSPGRGGGMFQDEISPEELFNMFFGGGGFGGGGFGGPGFAFNLGGMGGPGVRIHQFGGTPGLRRRGPRNANNPQNANDPQANADQAVPSFRSTITQLLPLILLFLLPLLSSLFDGSSSASSLPQFKFDRAGMYTQKRTTPSHKIPYYVNPKDVSDWTAKKLGNLDRVAEVRFVDDLRRSCNNELLAKRRKFEDAQGWVFVDQAKEKEARDMPMPSCQRLEDLRERY